LAFASTCRCEGVKRISAGARSGLPCASERVRSKARRYQAAAARSHSRCGKSASLKRRAGE
ncbi:hypothetical protein, partial [Methylobacterium variabile]|uniref:hypothetical protein n=1 Tax=Methylobacterium variabile TaxID=298794 RepID=UPI001ADFB624